MFFKRLNGKCQLPLSPDKSTLVYLRLFLLVATIWVFSVNSVAAQWDTGDDQAYIEDFLDLYSLADPLLSIEDYVQSNTYERWMGDSLDRAINSLRDGSDISHWSIARRMISLNHMYQNTDDDRYLLDNLRLIDGVLSVRDDRREPPIPLHTGEIAPVWGDADRSSLGRVVYSVHTGMLTFPMLEFLYLSLDNNAVLAKFKPGEFDTKLAIILESVDYHDIEWRDGPGKSEGRYVFRASMVERKRLHEQTVPTNYLSAMGRAHWMAWLVAKDKRYRTCAVKLATYIRRRMSPATNGGLYWGYYLTVDPVSQTPLSIDEIPQGWSVIPKIEDISHGALTVTFPVMMAEAGMVFTQADLKSLCHTVINGFARLDNGILFGRIHGDPTSAPPREAKGGGSFLSLSPHNPEVYKHLADWFRKYEGNPSSEEIAELIRYLPQKKRINKQPELEDELTP